MPIGNAIFAVAWFCAGGAFVFEALRTRGRDRAVSASIGLVFFVFAISDVIEIFTGAWWRPWWLLLMKVLCCVVLVTLALVFRDRSPARQESEGDTETVR